MSPTMPATDDEARAAQDLVTGGTGFLGTHLSRCSPAAATPTARLRVMVQKAPPPGCASWGSSS